MRITSGHLKNRRFDAPSQEVRPTMEAVREALFSSLGGHCSGRHVLDLFAGSGSLGLEAWSREASAVTFVEQNSAVCAQLRETIQALEGEAPGSVRCVKADAFRFLEQNRSPFDLILADPPYDLPDALQRTLEGIAGHSALTREGLLVYELRSKNAIEIPKEWIVLRDKTYGKTRLLTLKLNSKDES